MDSLSPQNPTALELADLLTLRRIRDMWANRLPDDEIQDVLGINKTEWKRLMTVLKQNALPDNHIEFEKFVARVERRSKDLERVRNHAEAVEELGTAVKCVQLENDMDRALLEFGQKLGILRPEVIKVEGQVQHDVRLQALFAHLPEEAKKAAEADMKELVQSLITEGVTINADDPGKGSGNKE
jgi:hypothetical protein